MPSSGPESVTLVVPVFNSAQTVEELCRRIGATASQLAPRYELILVDDGSRDGSWAEVQKQVAKHPWIRGIALMRNYGQHNALLCGIREAQGELTVTLDDDLQNPPEEIPRMIATLLEQDADVVYGTSREAQHGLFRSLASRITKIALQEAMGAATARNVSAFRVFRTRLRDAFSDYSSPLLSIDVLLTWASSRFVSLPVRLDARKAGRSNYTLRKLIAHALNMVTGFTVLPLQVASVLGFSFTLFGGAVLALVVGRYFLQGGATPGFPFLASIIAIFSGAQLVSLGMIGEYLARIHLRSMGRPCYVVRGVAGRAR